MPMRRNDESGGVKLCRDCGEVKPLSDYYRESGKETHRSVCKPCYGVRNRKERTPEQRAEQARKMREKRARETPVEKRTRYLKAYSTTIEWFDAQWDAQGRGCAICGVGECETGRMMAVDHDHACCATTPTCGECNRGILCWGCNIGLGNFKDNIDIVRSAVQYLAQTQIEVRCNISGYTVYAHPRHLETGHPKCPCHDETMEEAAA